MNAPTLRALGALLLFAPACAGEPPVPAPAAPTGPPAVVVIAPPTATPTSTPAPVTVATAEPESVTPGPDPRPLPPTQLDRWRGAVEDYTPSVQAGNTTPLDTARDPFATYLVAVHNRIHPLFTDRFLGALGKLPPDHPLNRNLITHVEIVLDRHTGKLMRMGVTKSSGVTAFDVATLDTVDRAAPFGKAPDAIVSPDGKVYLHWEFHRDPVDACSTRNARPFMLKSAP